MYSITVFGIGKLERDRVYELVDAQTKKAGHWCS